MSGDAYPQGLAAGALHAEAVRQREIAMTAIAIRDPVSQAVAQALAESYTRLAREIEHETRRSRLSVVPGHSVSLPQRGCEHANAAEGVSDEVPCRGGITENDHQQHDQD